MMTIMIEIKLMMMLLLLLLLVSIVSRAYIGSSPAGRIEERMVWYGMV